VANVGNEKPQVNFLSPQFFNPLLDGGRGPKILLKMCKTTRADSADSSDVDRWAKDYSDAGTFFGCEKTWPTPKI